VNELWVGDAPGGNYVEKSRALMKDLPKGQVYNVEIAHDDWCAIHKKKPCNCDPDIEIKRLERDGSLHPIDL